MIDPELVTQIEQIAIKAGGAVLAIIIFYWTRKIILGRR